MQDGNANENRHLICAKSRLFNSFNFYTNDKNYPENKSVEVAFKIRKRMKNSPSRVTLSAKP